jgi:lysyl-tRNA synthetase class 2
MVPESRIEILQKRAAILEKCRSFFSHNKIIEVDCPLLVSYPNLDNHIESFSLSMKPKRYLITSPEYAMKRLLSEGMEAIYQISHVFRKKEIGSMHNPEFTLIEWYEKNISYKKFHKHVLELIHVFFKPKKIVLLTYEEAFLKWTKINPFKTSCAEIKKYLKNENIFLSKSILKEKNIDVFLDIILSSIIQPKMEKEVLYRIDSYPASQAALAQIQEYNGHPIAERFEYFYNGIELGNGYHELANAKEQKERFEKTKKSSYAIDTRFLEALEKGIGNCYGIALGFDRLLMIHLNKTNIKEIMPFSYLEI